MESNLDGPIPLNDEAKALPAEIVSAAPQPIGAHAATLETSIQGVNAPLAGFLNSLGRPAQDMLAAWPELKFVLQSFEQIVGILPYHDRAKALYLSKFSVSIAVGLFDAALNLLWEETILALCWLATAIDLSYLFDTAEKREASRAQVQAAGDLASLEDLVPIAPCAMRGLASHLNRERLRHVNYLRNHADTAYPNQNEPSTQERIAWLANCLKAAVTAEPEKTVVVTKRLLSNV